MFEETLKVKKKSGEEVEFDRNKVFNSIIGATATPDEAEEITKKIEEWIKDSQEVVSTVVIREKVVDLLGGVNPSAASLYEKFDKEK